MLKKTSLVLALSAVVSLNLLRAETPPAKEVVRIDAKQSRSGLQPGSALVLAVHFNIPEGYHLFHHEYSYEKDFTFPAYAKIAPQAVLVVSDPFYTSCQLDPEDQTKVYHTSLTVVFQVQPAAGTLPGEYPLTVQYGYQTCSDVTGMCLPPLDAELKVMVPVVGAGDSVSEQEKEYFDKVFGTLEDPVGWRKLTGIEVEPAAQAAGGVEAGAATGEDALVESGGFDIAAVIERSGYLFLFAMMFVFGIGTSLTPCVYPMIPITMSFFVSQVEKSRLRVVLMAAAYVMGIAVTYATLGVVVAAIGGTFGAYANHPAVIIPLIVIFVALGVSMLGVFEIRIPAVLSGRMLSETKSGMIGAFIMGIFLGFIAAPCVMPVVGTLLTFVAQTGNYLLGFWGMFIFAWGMGLIFFILAMFPKAISAMPRSGMWMDGVKRFFAFIIFGVAVYYLGQLLQNNSVATLVWAVYLLGTGAFLLIGNVKSAPFAAWGRLRKGLFILLGLTMIVAGFGLVRLGVAEWSSPPEAPSPAISPHRLAEAFGLWAAGEESLIAWRGYSENIPDPIALARETGKPVFVDFWATWCKNCKVMERTTFMDPAVAKAFDGYEAFKVQAEKTESEGGLLLKRLQAINSNTGESATVAALPCYIIIDAKGDVGMLRFGIMKPEEVISALNSHR
ncbi:thioredoxin family protein [bacterium]|nr:thioredoxin family protein [candidate division CSSED10-310 bacterium]